ncbi:arylacetamide deacetylase-like 4 [Fukomys damarensis]|uniref:Arylacetamide deacetylase-like 4 n=1 Tax=Fukomys damarensis TaxID=885580 RepID=A0A091DMX7_FUKDA|nr:arylacetamide deacetylase-like 4 [Fukomys damarensis]KFO31620.1 Arylacetamide deacetylase-like 4 [Fukomys damarensis]
MNILLEILLIAACILGLSISMWVLMEHFRTAHLPSAISHPVKLQILHCILLLVVTWGNILEKLKICSMPHFCCFLQDIFVVKENLNVVVTDLRFGTIPVRLFQPQTVSSSPRRGIVFYHGGGAMFGSLDSYHNLCSFLSRETDSVVLLVGYRQLPDHHHPVLIQDCLTATVHFLINLSAYGVDPSRVVLCGDSMGGWAVVMVIQALVNRTDLPHIRAQILIYTVIQCINLQLPSHQQNKNVPPFTQEFMLMCVCKYFAIDFSWREAMLSGACIHPDHWKKYRKWLSSDNIPKRYKKKYHEAPFPGPFDEAAYLETKQALDVKVTPILVDDEIIAQLPEAFLVSCENDILRDDTLLYKKRLEDQKVPVSWYHAEDGFHGCVSLFSNKVFSFPCTQNIMNAVVSYIKGV